MHVFNGNGGAFGSFGGLGYQFGDTGFDLGEHVRVIAMPWSAIESMPEM